MALAMVMMCIFFSTADAPYENVIHDYPCAPATQYEEEAIQMIENPAYATITVY